MVAVKMLFVRSTHVTNLSLLSHFQNNGTTVACSTPVLLQIHFSNSMLLELKGVEEKE